MSGTSVDGIDAVLLDVSSFDQPQIISTYSAAMPAALRTTLRQLATPGTNEIDLAGQAHTELGERYAEAAIALIDQAAGTKVCVIGCHGQTVRHRPSGKHPFTLQLGNGALLCQRTGIPVVTDFRSADMAAGGQGAPFAPFFHRAVFSSHRATRAIVNLGGIANVTVLPKDSGSNVIGFDTGPASCLMDAWIEKHHGKRFDENGDWAASGKLSDDLLQQCLSDPYFHAAPPKSTGREYFNLDWLAQQLNTLPEPLIPSTVQNTLAQLTARSIVDQLPPAVDQVFVCGGGVHNGYLRGLLDHLTTVSVADTSELGIAPEWIEASAFAWMATATLQHTPSTLPSVTGARQASITGAIYYP